MVRGYLRKCLRGVLGTIFLSALSFLAGCPFDQNLGNITPSPSPSPSKIPVVKNCVLPSDQAGSLTWKWKVIPVQLALQAGAFSSEEIAAVSKAVAIWNTFYKESSGIQVMFNGESGKELESAQARVKDLCQSGSGIIQNGQFVGAVVIYKFGENWPWSEHSAIAVTSTCKMPTKPLVTAYNAMIDLNYEDFFVEGKKRPDLTSILVHEFGHLLGLDHSCDLGGKAGLPNCNSANLPETYRRSVVFPSVSFDQNGEGEKRTDLTENDMGRANCLYSGSGK